MSHRRRSGFATCWRGMTPNGWNQGRGGRPFTTTSLQALTVSVCSLVITMACGTRKALRLVFLFFLPTIRRHGFEHYASEHFVDCFGRSITYVFDNCGRSLQWWLKCESTSAHVSLGSCTTLCCRACMGF